MRVPWALPVGLVAVVLSSFVGINAQPAGSIGGEQTAAIDALLSKWDQPDVPGCVVGVVHRGELVYGKGFGSANLEYRAPATTQTVFDIMSLSKTFTCAAIAILMDEGRLSPDDELRKFVPEMHAFDETIRIRDLVQCKSGIWDQTSITVLLGWENAPLQMPQRGADFFALLAGQRKLQVKPGMEHRYSSGDYFLLGIIVQRITGQSLAQFARERLFQPLGMERTFYEEDPTHIVQQRAVGHWKPMQSEWHIWRPTAYWVGGGNVNTCVEDLARWDAAFLRRKLPRGECLDELLTEGTLLGNRYCLDADAAIKLANPLAAEDAPPGTYRGLKRLQFTGGAWGMTSAMTRFPEQELTVICLTSNEEIKAWVLNRQVADLLLAGQLRENISRPLQQPASESPVVTLSAAERSRLLGHYRPKGASGAAWTVSLAGDGLELIDHLRQKVPLRMLNATTLDPDGPYFYATTRFVFEEEGDTSAFTAEWDEPEYRGRIEFERVKLAVPTVGELEACAGEYECAELAVTYRVIVRDGALWLRIGSRRWEQLDPTVRDEFIPHVREPADQRVIQFLRDERGKVTRLAAHYYRVKDIQFVRRKPDQNSVSDSPL